MDQINHITCDRCGNEIQLEQVLAKNLKKDFDLKLREELSKLSQNFELKQKQLEEAKSEFEEKKKRENELFKKKIDKEKELLRAEIYKKTGEEYEMRLKAQSEDLKRQTAKLNELQEKAIEVERLKRSIGEREKELEFQFEKRLRQEQLEMEEKIRKQLDEKTNFKMAEKNKQLEDLKKQIEEMKRKAEQGSMQIQGEVQELAIEQYLRENFPFDHIDEIKKGARGADCLQVVNTRSSVNCGTIYYESKRTKEFSPSWIEKFKTDMRLRSADIGVLVSQARPKGANQLIQKSGIWICTFEEFKALCFVLRDGIIRVHQSKKMQENRGDKMEMLYEFLTSNEFSNQIEGIVEGFNQMHLDLQKERNAMEKLWKQREKQIQKVLLNTTNMYGSIKGIAGNSIQDVKLLEFPNE